MGKFFGDPEGGVGADEVHGSDFHRVRTDEDKFQNVLRTGDAADADDRDLDRIADLPDAAQGHGLHGGAGEPPHHIGEQRLAGLHIDAHAGDGVDAGDSIGSGLLGGLGDGGDVRHVGRQLHDDGQVPRVFLDRLGHFGGEGRNVEYREGLYVGYRYYQTAGVPVAFPFGYGLSYTAFEYSDLKADEKGVTLTVTNTGSCAGAEIVQLYVAKQDAKIFRPAQELKGFAKVFLASGESRTVSIALDDKAFRYWNVKTDRWEVEGGSYQLRVGASSADIRLTAEVSVKGTNAPDPYEGLDLLHYVSGQIAYVTDAEFEALLGHPIPEDVVRIDRNMTLGEMDHGRSPLGWVAQKVLRCRLDSSFAKGTPDLNTVFQYNMPLRALAKMTNGMVSMGMVDGLVWELKGFWLVGIVRVIYEFIKNAILNAQLEKRLRQG